MEEMDIDDGDSEGGHDQENEAEALNIMLTEEQADFHRPAAASRCVADCRLLHPQAMTSWQ